MKIVKGDLITLALAGEFDVIIHGCNCFCRMGAGIAKSIIYEFPEAFKADRSTMKGDESKLGSYTCANVTREGYSITIVNAYTQYDYRGKHNVDYEAIRKVFRKIKSDFVSKMLGFPLIGAGLAGGDWNIISKIIDEELLGEDFTLVKFSSNSK